MILDFCDTANRLVQGKDVFAVPNSITSSTSISTNQLIKSGCKVVISEKDVLEYYGWGGSA